MFMTWLVPWFFYSLLRFKVLQHLFMCVYEICSAAQGSTFLDSCDFERENICGMMQGQGDQADWDRVTTATGGPDTDYSNMGKCTGENNLLWNVWKDRFIFLQFFLKTMFRYFLVYQNLLCIEHLKKYLHRNMWTYLVWSLVYEITLNIFLWQTCKMWN